jgi:transposase
MALTVRPLPTEEAQALSRMAPSRTAPHRVVPRAPLVWASAHGETVPVIAPQVGLSAFRVRAWIQRVNRDGLAGLRDAPRSGRPGRHDETVRGTVIALARPKPRGLGCPLALWPLTRLQRALREHHGLDVTPATIWTWLQAEGLVWKRQQSWFQVTVEAALAETRGPSSEPTRRPSRHDGSSASMRSAR